MTPTAGLRWVRPPRQERSQQTLHRILDAAEALVSDKGFEDTPVAEVVRRAGRPRLREVTMRLDHLVTADEVFLTSTGIEVLPVSGIDGKPIGDARPGPTTCDIARAYRRVLDRELGPVAP